MLAMKVTLERNPVGNKHSHHLRLLYITNMENLIMKL